MFFQLKKLAASSVVGDGATGHGLGNGRKTRESQAQGGAHTRFRRGFNEVARAGEDDEELAVAVAHRCVQGDSSVGAKSAVNVGVAVNCDRGHDDGKSRRSTHAAADFFHRAHIVFREPHFFASSGVEGADPDFSWVGKEGIEVQGGVAVRLGDLVVEVIDVKHAAAFDPVTEAPKFRAVCDSGEGVVCALGISRHVVHGVRRTRRNPGNVREVNSFFDQSGDNSSGEGAAHTTALKNKCGVINVLQIRRFHLSTLRPRRDSCEGRQALLWRKLPGYSRGCGRRAALGTRPRRRLLR